MTGDNKYINKDNLRLYCNTNEGLLTDNNVTGLIVEFPGLGGSSCLGGSINRGDYNSPFTARCAENGIVVAYMFPGPWSWGNATAVRVSDSVVDAIADKYNLTGDFPIVVCGGSMGGQGCLMYSINSRHKIAAVAAACPCTDVLQAVYVHDDFPRTFITAVAEYDMPYEEGLKQISPIHNLDRFRKIPYFIAGDGDDEVFFEPVVDHFVDEMKKRYYDVIYKKQPGKRHGEFFPEVRQELSDFMIKYALAGKPEIMHEKCIDGNPLVVDEVRRINATQLRVYFSEPVDIIGNPFMAIRYSRDGVSVRRETINGEEVVLQFPGTWEFESEKHDTLLWTLSAPSTLGVDTVAKIMERAGDLYAFDGYIRFCIEEAEYSPNGTPINSVAGELYNVVARANRGKHLTPSVAIEGCGWEGLYLDIK